jgi:hypothetical protein
MVVHFFRNVGNAFTTIGRVKIVTKIQTVYAYRRESLNPDIKT